MDLQLLALLLVVVTLLAWRAVTRERRDYARFRRMRATITRQKVMRRWVVESLLVFAGLSASILLATWDQVPQLLATAQAWPVIAEMRGFLATPLGQTLAVVLGILAVAALVVPILLLRNASPDDIPKLGDIGPLIPRTRGELPYGAGLAVSAGVFEETMFRLAMPALLFGIVPDAALAFGGSVLLFGALHLYQKWVGVLASTLLGVVFTALYVLSGSLVLPIVLHVLVDLRTLVLLPLVVGKVWTIR